MEEWKRKLEKANDGKVGEPFHYPESYIRLLAFVRLLFHQPYRLLFHQPYRQTEGFVRFLSRFVDGLQVPDYSTIARRANRLQVELDESLVRSNGPMDVSSEKVGDRRRLKRLVNRARENGVRVGSVLADGGYDSKANFNFLAREGIKPVIRVSKGSVPKCNGSYARKLAVVEQQAFKSKARSRIHRFGYRWRVEGAFSVIKRVFGEYVSARKFVNMAKEMAMKASICNRFIGAAMA